MIKDPKRLGALALVATIALGACSGGGATTAPPVSSADAEPGGPVGGHGRPVSGTVTIDGSSTVYPITEAVAEEFQNANTGVQVSVAFSGTGGGFKKFCVGETDINDASRPIKAEDDGRGPRLHHQQHRVRRAAGRDRRPDRRRQPGERLRDLPDRRGAGQDLRPRLAPGPQVERRPMPTSRPSRSTATCRAPTRARSTTSPRTINGEVDAATQYATQSEDDNVLVTGVAGDVNAIGFFGYAYYVENTDKLKAVEVDGGDGCVAPTDDTINDNTYAPLSRPLFIYPNVDKAKERPELKAFVDFYLDEHVGPLGRGRLRRPPGRPAPGREGRVGGRRRRLSLDHPPPARTGSKLGSGRCVVPSRGDRLEDRPRTTSTDRRRRPLTRTPPDRERIIEALLFLVGRCSAS